RCVVQRGRHRRACSAVVAALVGCPPMAWRRRRPTTKPAVPSSGCRIGRRGSQDTRGPRVDRRPKRRVLDAGHDGRRGLGRHAVLTAGHLRCQLVAWRGSGADGRLSNGARGSPMDAANAERAPAPGLTPAPSAAELSDRDQAILAFERQWWKFAGAKEQAIRLRFDLSATRYYQGLNP